MPLQLSHYRRPAATSAAWLLWPLPSLSMMAMFIKMLKRNRAAPGGSTLQPTNQHQALRDDVTVFHLHMHEAKSHSGFQVNFVKTLMPLAFRLQHWFLR
jgi:hypothetical protein